MGSFPFSLNRTTLWRLAPELCALAVFAFCVFEVHFGNPNIKSMVREAVPFETVMLVNAAVWGYLLSGVVLLLGPAVLTATTLADEKANGTLESILLTTSSRHVLVWRTFLRQSFPWLRFAIYAVVFHWIVVDASMNWGWHENRVDIGGAFALTPRATLFSGVERLVRFRQCEVGWSAAAFGWALLRVLADVPRIGMTVAISILVSLRARSVVEATVGSIAGVLMAQAVAAFPVFIGQSAFGTDWPYDSRVGLGFFLCGAISSLVIYVVATVVILRVSARNLDKYVLAD